MPYPMTPVKITANTTLRREQHAHRPLCLDLAAGMTITLPASVGNGDKYEFYVTTTLTGNGIIKVANSTDVIQGAIPISGGTAGTFGSVAATSDTITMNGSTTGGLVGSRVIICDAQPGKWIVESAALVGSGVAATPFSATV